MQQKNPEEQAEPVSFLRETSVESYYIFRLQDDFVCILRLKETK